MVGVSVQCDDVNTECGVYPVGVCLSAIPDFRVIFEQVNGDIERVVFHEEDVACISVNVRHDECVGSRRTSFGRSGPLVSMWRGGA